MGEDDKRTFRKGCFLGIVLSVVLIFGFFSVYSLLSSRHHGKHTNIIPQQYPISRAPSVRKVPDFIIIGVRKGGTKALISMLNLHPNIIAARGEVHFFDRPDRYEKPDGMSWYIGRMPLSTADQYVVEKTPNYFVNPEVPMRMAESLPKTLKLILIVRDPITRAVSDYTQLDIKRTKQKKVRQPFERYVFDQNGDVKTKTSVVRDSLYDVHFKRWLHYFNRDQILVLDGNQLISNPSTELVKVEKYLNVQPYFTEDKFYFNKTKGFYCWTTKRSMPKCLGTAKGRKHQDLSEDTRNKLTKFFTPHMKSFCEIANVKFSFCPT